MRTLLTSDVHGNIDKFKAVIKNEKCDFHFDMGDFCAQYINQDKTLFTQGNCDRIETMPLERIIKVADEEYLIVHGHQQNVKFGLKDLIKYAKSKKITKVCYGHTHVPNYQIIDGVCLINPGSLSTGSYAVIEDGFVHFKKISQ